MIINIQVMYLWLFSFHVKNAQIYTYLPMNPLSYFYGPSSDSKPYTFQGPPVDLSSSIDPNSMLLPFVTHWVTPIVGEAGQILLVPILTIIHPGTPWKPHKDPWGFPGPNLGTRHLTASVSMIRSFLPFGIMVVTLHLTVSNVWEWIIIHEGCLFSSHCN